MLRVLHGLRAGGRTSFSSALSRLSEVIHRRSLVIVVSDMFDNSNDAVQLLRRLRARGQEVAVFQLLHPDEVEFPFDRVLLFESMEDGRKMLVDPAGLRGTYLRDVGPVRCGS